MSPEQQSHLYDILAWTSKGVIPKYVHGQQEHGGDMWEKSGMLYCLWQECFDFLTYVYTVSRQIEERDPELYRFLMSPGEEDR